MSGSLTLYSGFGVALGQVKSPKYDVEWRINTVTRLRFSLSTSDAACREDWLQFGNLVLVEPGNGLPAWGGVIDTPREWGRGSVTVTAYSAEHLLGWRRPAQMGQTLKGTAGAIFRQIVQMATAAAFLPVEVGEIFEGGASREETLEDDLLAECQRIAGRARHEFDLTPIVRDGRLIFRANWYERMGQQTDLVLEEKIDLQLSDRPLTEQGEIVNDVLGYGDGATWKSRPTVIKTDAASSGRYMHRQGISGFDGNSETGTLEENTALELGRTAYPVNVLDIRATNVRGAWGNIRKGNNIRAILRSVGFLGSGTGLDVPVRIAGMGYDCVTCRVVGEER